MASRMTGLLVAGMLITGCANSLLTKAQDMVCVKDCDTTAPQGYNQPVYQTLVMFLGELLCLFALYGSRFARRSAPTAPEKGKYEALARYDPAEAAGDSGVVLGMPDDYEPAVKVKPGDGPPFAGHGAVPAPTAAALDDVEEAPEDKLTWRQQCLFIIPTCCDLLGTTAMNLGLVYTGVSTYQMIRGALVLWVGMFSVVFLHRRLTPSQWASLFVVMLGVTVVGLSSALETPEETLQGNADVGQNVLGICLVLFAQVFTASQFVIEEKIMTSFGAIKPLRAVGLEGLFGVISTTLTMIILHVVAGRQHPGTVFDIADGWRQLTGNQSIMLYSCAIAVSIGLFNAAGLSVTRQISATARSTIDTCRTVGIWAVSLALGWESFRSLQVVGFCLLVYGTFVFNGIATFPSMAYFRQARDSRTAEVVPSSARSSSSRPTSRPPTMTRRSAASLERGNERTPLLSEGGTR